MARRNKRSNKSDQEKRLVSNKPSCVTLSQGYGLSLKSKHLLALLKSHIPDDELEYIRRELEMEKRVNQNFIVNELFITFIDILHLIIHPDARLMIKIRQLAKFITEKMAPQKLSWYE